MKGDMRVPVASVYRTGGVGGLMGCVGVAASAPTVHHHHIDHDEEQISRLAHHLSQISTDHEGLQVCALHSCFYVLCVLSIVFGIAYCVICMYVGL